MANANKQVNRTKLEMWVRISRWALLMIAAFSTFNCVRPLFGSHNYFLFSAMMPLYLVMDGCILTGKFPDSQPETLFPDWYLWVVAGIAFILIAVYAVCYLVSRRKPFPGLLTGLIWLVMDTLSMPIFWGFPLPMLREYLIHALLIALLIAGLVSQRKLRDLPPPEPEPEWKSYYDDDDEPSDESEPDPDDDDQSDD